MEAASAAACTVCSAAAAPARRVGVGVVVAVVGSGHIVASTGVLSGRVECMSCLNRCTMRFLVVVVAVSVYMLLVAECRTIGVVRRSRGGWCRGVAGVRRIDFSGDYRYVGWGRSLISRYVIILNRGVSAKLTFQIGLAVGDR